MKYIAKRLLLPFLMIGILFPGMSQQSSSSQIRVNQLGYFPNTQKLAAVINLDATSFEIRDASNLEVVYDGELEDARFWAASEENVRIADFSNLLTPGNYVLTVDDQQSHPFSISENLFGELNKGVMKAFYYNRASTALLSANAGVYARAAGHLDNQVVVHPSAADADRSAGDIISTPYGWYDAGDYNKYVVNSGISTYTLLSAYETYPDYYDTLEWNIPESGNGIPDILDEAFWNVRWMATMQAPDGGVYNKTTTANFAGFVMPNQATATRYVVAKGTAATLDFAAIMAMAARVYAPYDATFAQEALTMAEKAWDWAESNPNVAYNNPGAVSSFPAITTGGYGDSNFDDEFLWAAVELYISTKDASYLSDVDLANESFVIPGWPSVDALGLISLVTHRKEIAADVDTVLIKEKLISLAQPARELAGNSIYRIPAESFGWGSNSEYANRGMVLMQAFKITGELGYYNAAISAIDYLLGRNATTYSFVTGFGDKTPMDIHHRVSGADGIAEPIPGFLVGGPNPGNQADDCGTNQYPSTLPAKSYVDLLCSYSTNEVTINWNAPMAFLAGALQVEYLGQFKDGLPDFLDLSTAALSFPFEGNIEQEFSINSNINWTLSTAEEWVNVSPVSGFGNGKVTVSTESFDFEDTVRTGYIYINQNDQKIDSILIKQSGKFLDFVIQAEDFIDMNGITLETTTDDGGGSNVGFVDAGDWIDYGISISEAGLYDLAFRYAGALDNPDFDVIVDDEVLLNVKLTATGGWQTWETETFQICLPAGYYNMRLNFNNPATNLNWMSFTWVSAACPDEPLGLDTESISFGIYPNPATDFVTLHTDHKYAVQSVYTLSLDGRITSIHSLDQTNKLDISTLTKGMYLIVVKYVNGESKREKLIVQ